MRHAWRRLCLVVAMAAACGRPSGAVEPPGDAPAGPPGDAAVEPDAGGPPLTLALLAGNIGGAGNVDGVGIAARFASPQSVAVDGAGNVFVADAGNSAIRKITPAAAVTTFAGAPGELGSADGAGGAARFAFPNAIVVGGTGTLYVADNNTIRAITPAGDVTTLAGAPGMWGTADGHGADARFRSPAAVATDHAGNVYVADDSADTIRQITPAGDVSTFAGMPGVWGTADGTGSDARFTFPDGLAVDAFDNVYVGDAANSTIRKITPARVVTTIAGAALQIGADDGLRGARFWAPAGMASDATGHLYVADAPNNAIRKLVPGGVVTTIAGAAELRGSDDNPGAGARFNEPQSVAVDPAGNAYVTDVLNHTIRKITPAGLVSTLAGKVGKVGHVDGTGSAARFGGPGGIASDGAGNLFVTDGDTIRRVTLDGEVTTFAGTAGSPGSSDGAGAAARFKGLNGIASDAAGNLFVSDSSNWTIRKITPAAEVSTLAGTAGMAGAVDATGPDARFIALSGGIAVDGAGNVYVAQDDCTIRRITAAGVVTTVAGSADVRASDDGTGAAARFHLPFGLAADPAGNIYVADQGNAAIRKLTPSGVVTTIAGSARTIGIALGTSPHFASPVSVAIHGDALLVIDGGALLVLHDAIR